MSEATHTPDQQDAIPETAVQDPNKAADIAHAIYPHLHIVKYAREARDKGVAGMSDVLEDLEAKMSEKSDEVERQYDETQRKMKEKKMLIADRIMLSMRHKIPIPFERIKTANSPVKNAYTLVGRLQDVGDKDGLISSLGKEEFSEIRGTAFALVGLGEPPTEYHDYENIFDIGNTGKSFLLRKFDSPAGFRVVEILNRHAIDSENPGKDYWFAVVPGDEGQ